LKDFKISKSHISGQAFLYFIDFFQELAKIVTGSYTEGKKPKNMDYYPSFFDKKSIGLSQLAQTYCKSIRIPLCSIRDQHKLTVSPLEPIQNHGKSSNLTKNGPKIDKMPKNGTNKGN